MLTKFLVVPLAFLGAAPQDAPQALQVITPATASTAPSALFSAAQDRPLLGVMLTDADGGARITEVLEGTAAQAAGLQAGDILVRVGGQQTGDSSAVVAQIGLRKAGDPLSVIVVRGDERLELVAELGGGSPVIEARPAAPAAPRADARPPQPPQPTAPRIVQRVERVPAPDAPADERPFLGVTLRSGGGDGVVIDALTPGAAAEQGGLQPGDRILAIEGVETGDYEDLVERLGELSVGDFVAIRIERGDDEEELLIQLGSRGGSANAAEAPSQGFFMGRADASDGQQGGLRIRVNGEDVDPGELERLGDGAWGRDGNLRIEVQGDFDGDLEELLGSLGEGDGLRILQGGIEGLEELDLDLELDELMSELGDLGRHGGGGWMEHLEGLGDLEGLEDLGGLFEGLELDFDDIDIEELGMRAEHFAHQAEHFAEEFSEQAERWAEEAEVWAEDWAEGMEFWAQSFADQSDVWTDVLEAQSERFAEQFEDMDFDIQVNGQNLRDLLGSGGGLNALRGSSGGSASGHSTHREIHVDSDGNRREVFKIGEPDGSGGWSWRVVEGDGSEPIVLRGSAGGGSAGGDARAMRPTEVTADPIQMQLDELRAELDALRAENAALRAKLEQRR